MDAILLHDAVMYLTTEEDLYQTFVSAKTVFVKEEFFFIVPDVYLEDFEEHFLAGGEDGFIDSIPVSVRLTEWHWRSSEQRNQIFVEFSMLVRHGEQEVQSIHEKPTHSDCFHESNMLIIYRKQALHTLSSEKMEFSLSKVIVSEKQNDFKKQRFEYQQRSLCQLLCNIPLWVTQIKKPSLTKVCFQSLRC